MVISDSFLYVYRRVIWVVAGFPDDPPAPLDQALPITWSPVDVSVWEHWCKRSTWSRSLIDVQQLGMTEVVWYKSQIGE